LITGTGLHFTFYPIQGVYITRDPGLLVVNSICLLSSLLSSFHILETLSTGYRNLTLQYIALSLRIREVLASILASQAGHSATGFHGFPLHLHHMLGYYIVTCLRCLFSLVVQRCSCRHMSSEFSFYHRVCFLRGPLKQLNIGVLIEFYSYFTSTSGLLLEEYL